MVETLMVITEVQFQFQQNLNSPNNPNNLTNPNNTYNPNNPSNPSNPNNPTQLVAPPVDELAKIVFTTCNIKILINVLQIQPKHLEIAIYNKGKRNFWKRIVQNTRVIAAPH
jgi:hypothetical protein